MRDRRPWLLAALVGGALLGSILIAAGETVAGHLALLAGMGLLGPALGLSLNAQIGIALVLGISVGLWPESGIADVRFVGRLFIALLKMLIAPMIFLSVTNGIAGMREARAVGSLGGRTVALYLVTMAFAVATGLAAVNVFEPGTGGALAGSAFFDAATAGGTPDAARDLGLGAFLLKTLYQVFANPIASLAEGRILPIVAFALLLGLALLQGGEAVRPLVDLVRAANDVVQRIIGWFIRLAPIGIYALIGHLVATLGLRELLQHLGAFSAVVIGATLFHAAVTLPLVARVLAGIGPLELWRGIREALVVAFTTSSSAATLPITQACVEQNLGVSPRVSSFVLPLGATVNMDGTALYEAIAALFIANVYGIELGLGGQLVVFAITMLAAIGAPGIPSAGMVTLVVVFESVGLPGEAVGVLITIDRFLDTFRTMANVEGDAVVAACVQAGESGAPSGA